jgi:hypothetical protein
MSIEATKQALEALGEKFTSGNSIEVERATITRDEYLSLRQAIEVAENQKPVAWRHTLGGDVQLNTLSPEYYGDHWKNEPLYAASLQSEKQEPSDRRVKVKLGSQFGSYLNGNWFYLHPADEFANEALSKHSGISGPLKREWIELTVEELANEASQGEHAGEFALGAMWAAAVLKKKNHE